MLNPNLANLPINLFKGAVITDANNAPLGLSSISTTANAPFTFWCTLISLRRKCDIILEKCGIDGWELVNFQCVGALGSMMILVFKRAK